MSPPDEIRLECLRLALAMAASGADRWDHYPGVGDTISAAARFEAFVRGEQAPKPEPAEPGSMAEAIDKLRAEVPGMVRDAMGAAYDP